MVSFMCVYARSPFISACSHFFSNSAPKKGEHIFKKISKNERNARTQKARP